MPRPEKTRLVLRSEAILHQIEDLREKIRVKEEILEEINEIVRVKGPFVRGKMNKKYLEDLDY